MKKILFMALVLTTLTTTAFSNITDNISRRVLTNFKRTYTSAANVKWDTAGDWMKATFTVDGQQMFAYYRDNGDEVAATRNLAVSQLPISLSTELRGRYNGQWLTNLFEISAGGETSYYATLNSADHVTVLKASPFGSWNIFRKIKNTSR